MVAIAIGKGQLPRADVNLGLAIEFQASRKLLTALVRLPVLPTREADGIAVHFVAPSILSLRLLQPSSEPGRSAA
jgi:hypothetical protein